MRSALALGLSVVLHAAVAAVSVFRAAAVSVAAPAPKSATRVALFEVTESASPPPPSVQPRPMPRSHKPASVTTARPAVMGDLAPSEVGEEEPGTPGPSSSPSTDGTAAEAEETTPPSAGRAIDLSALHAALAQSARTCYPPAAKRFGLVGEAQLDFCLDDRGSLASATLSRSTGQGLLDTAARDCVLVKAMPLPAQASGGCYSLPVRFGR